MAVLARVVDSFLIQQLEDGLLPVLTLLLVACLNSF